MTGYNQGTGYTGGYNQGYGTGQQMIGTGQHLDSFNQPRPIN